MVPERGVRNSNQKKQPAKVLIACDTDHHTLSTPMSTLRVKGKTNQATAAQERKRQTAEPALLYFLSLNISLLTVASVPNFWAELGASLFPLPPG